ncbi:hypothetical protein B7494_g6713 [Chlorociboria aeruginascens]|nr:hypothetical protein B7494_g6713 [Chlorociboria aeruginascens]
MDGRSRSTPWPVELLLDGDGFWEKIPLLFFIVNNLAEEHRIFGSVNSLDQAIGYAKELTKVLATKQPQPPYESTTITAVKLLMILLERKIDKVIDIKRLTKLVAATKAHLELATPARPLSTLGTLGNACAQHYRLSKDHDILLEAIEYLQQYLNMVEKSDVDVSLVGEPDQALHLDQIRGPGPGPGSSDESNRWQSHKIDRLTKSREVYLDARLILVRCLEELYRAEKKVDVLNQLIFECDCSLKVFYLSRPYHFEI